MRVYYRKEFTERLVETSLGKVVGCFDDVCRRAMKVHARKSGAPALERDGLSQCNIGQKGGEVVVADESGNLWSDD